MSEENRYAVIRSSGKQYRVAKGDKIIVDRLSGDAGGEVKLGDVLYLGGESTKVGAPLISGASVPATIVRHLRGEKVLIYKKRRRKGYTKKIGHRQEQTELLIGDIK